MLREPLHHDSRAECVEDLLEPNLPLKAVSIQLAGAYARIVPTDRIASRGVSMTSRDRDGDR